MNLSTEWQMVIVAFISGPCSVLIVKYVTERKAARESARMDEDKEGRAARSASRIAEINLLPTMMDRYNQRLDALEQDRRHTEDVARTRVEHMEHTIARMAAYITELRADYARALMLVGSGHNLPPHDTRPAFEDPK